MRYSKLSSLSLYYLSFWSFLTYDSTISFIVPFIHSIIWIIFLSFWAKKVLFSGIHSLLSNFSWLYKINITSQLPLQFSVASDQVLRNAMYVNYPMTASEIFYNRYPAGTLCTYFFFLCSIFLLEFGLYFGLWKNIVMEPWAEWTCRLPDIFVK